MISANLIKQLKSAGYEGEFDLESMIKECGDERFFLLEQIPKGWIACYGKNPVCVKDFCKFPEEAVGFLLLKLLKK